VFRRHISRTIIVILCRCVCPWSVNLGFSQDEPAQLPSASTLRFAPEVQPRHRSTCPFHHLVKLVLARISRNSPNPTGKTSQCSIQLRRYASSSVLCARMPAAAPI
jgi:hypothetical protein